MANPPQQPRGPAGLLPLISRAARRLLDRAEFATLLALGLIAGGVWLFAELSDEVLEGSTASFDERVLLAFRTPEDLSDPVGPPWLEQIGRDFTALGGAAVLAIVVLAVTGFLLLRQQRRMAVFVLAAVISGVLLSALLKHWFARARPDLVSHGDVVYTASFPSGHSMMSAVVYLTLAALLARVQSRRRIKLYLLLVAASLTFAIGVSRVYLGVHWPTDVLAGWTAGATWALVCGVAARWLQRRGSIETEPAGDGGSADFSVEDRPR